MSTRAIATAILVAGAARLGHPSIGAAQGGALTAAFAVGGRVRVDSLDPHSRGKFEEYRHVPQGAFLQELRLDYLPAGANQLYKLVVREPGERDQGTWFRASAPDQWDFLARWDRITHTYSTTARTLGDIALLKQGFEPIRGVFPLPTPRPDTATWNRVCGSALPPACDPYLRPVRTQWDPVRLALSMTPSENWSSKAEYTFIKKTGDRPSGMAMGSPGNNFREVLQPIDQTVQDLRLTQGYARRSFQAVVSYNFSHFSNAFSSVTADNPLLTTSTVSGGPAQGRVALAPVNLAHTVAGTASLALPKHTRVTGTLQFGWRKQNGLFLPPTINSAILDSLKKANLLAASGRFIGDSSLNGDVHTTLFNLSASSRPGAHLILSGRFRYFDQSDHTPEITMPAEIMDDRTINLVSESREALPFSKTNAELTATWRFSGLVNLLAGWNYERWTRDTLVRNVHFTNEHSVRVALTANPVDWTQVRASFTKSWRRIKGEYFLTEDQPEGFRRYDQSDRNRDKLEVQAELTPWDQVSFGGIFIIGRSDYPNSAYGLTRERNFLAGGDLSWTPISRVTLGVDYTRETFKTQMRSRYREPTILTNLQYDWLSDNNDYIDTFGASINAEVLPGRLSVGGNLEVAKSRLVNLAINPTAPACSPPQPFNCPTGGTTSQNTSAQATNWPDITQKWIPARGWVEYKVNTDWAATAQVSFERFNKVDFRTDGLNPATGADIFLGNDFRNYRVMFMTFTISYRPRLLRPGRSAL